MQTSKTRRELDIIIQAEWLNGHPARIQTSSLKVDLKIYLISRLYLREVLFELKHEALAIVDIYIGIVIFVSE